MSGKYDESFSRLKELKKQEAELKATIWACNRFLMLLKSDPALSKVTKRQPYLSVTVHDKRLDNDPPEKQSVDLGDAKANSSLTTLLIQVVEAQKADAQRKLDNLPPP